MFQDIKIEELLERINSGDIKLIDVRSQGEYEEFTIPGSLNIPLFDNEERREVGTLYKQVSIQAAKEKGLEVVSRKLPAFIKEFEKLPERKAVFCWRGGMRSKTTATLLSLYGIRVFRLQGGIREYRRWVTETLENFPFQPECLVLNGLTGTGKTAILQKLAEQGFPVLDLEGLAQHRGSVFGHIGKESHNQKTFEALLLKKLLQLKDSPFIMMEAESSRIGKVSVPSFLLSAKESGRQWYLELPVDVRVKHILEDYRPEEHKAECIQAFDRIKSRIHTPIAKEIGVLLQEDRFADAVKLLLEHYYDSKYEYAANRYQSDITVIRADSVDQAVEKIMAEIPQPVGLPQGGIG